MDRRPRYRFEQFSATRQILGMHPAPDGESLRFVSDISGQHNLWQVPSRGGWPRQLTLFTEEVVREALFTGDGSRIAFVADHRGDEKYQVYLMEAVGGWPEKITDRPEVQYELGCFSPCGRYLAFSGNAANPEDMDIYIYDLETRETRQLTSGGGVRYVFSFSPDGSRLLAQQFYDNTKQDLLLVDVASGEIRNLTAGKEQKAFFRPGPWLKDGSGFYFLTNDGREFQGIGYYDLAADRWSYAVTDDWDIELIALNGDQTLMAYTVNEAGNSVLRVVERESGRALPLPELSKGMVLRARFAENDRRNRLFLQITTYKEASNIYVLDLEAGTLTRVTESMLGNIPEEVFVAPELVYIDAHDGLRIPAWLYRPHGAGPDAKVPAVLSIHGGPEAQERPNYNYGFFFQYLLHHGVAILAPNIRGSTGFGLDYQKRIHRDWGGDDLKDIEACNRYLRSLDWVDGERIGVWGGSYGGFATLSALSRLPDLWACGCDLCGPANLITFLKSVPAHWRPAMKDWLGDVDEDRDFLIARSPITYVDQIKAPLMIVQGAMDPRVIKAESDQMVERLRALGREVEYLVFEDEGHGFTKRANLLKAFAAMADFLIRHLVRR
ncbi:dipeptidyl aminopeptidase/acylaminoacyl peptidase [Symbiobacterium terraclitae]|uniref:Dipeptidyl aminopeptidase/acylaminoacyl peptidase n=1 Tax=Symbiobacterium terraclitae TaxID=557451 RepID=A0ABS4JRG0_9FIRM|nr:S9 family peptidase [Symbiobacterium terraclitae]MBP2018116.1 dipeptidyl aminopeptidase/acylaminoacyl peptidase [Symbiobacterium terraclitae]